VFPAKWPASSRLRAAMSTLPWGSGPRSSHTPAR
jgi:hypothetical protein